MLSYRLNGGKVKKMKRIRYRVYFKNNTIVILTGEFDAVKEVAETIANERKTTVSTITTF